MATTVGQHSVAAFTSPVNGTTPIDANTVRGNDNTVRVAYVDHDADPGIHVQSSTLASRPAAGTAGRKWITEDSGVYTLWFDDGTNWHPVSSENVALTVLAGENLVKGDVVKVTGWNNGQDLPEVSKVASASDVAFAVMTAAVSSGSMGYATNTGIVQDLATNSFSVGAILYPNTSGGFTATKPTSGTYQACAYVLRSNANNGVLYVEFSAPRIVESSSNTASTVVLRDASGNFSAGTITAGALTSTGLVTFASLKGTGATTVTNILDEDNMASDSATALATQQSIKAYVDAKVATVDTLAEVLANGNTTGANDIIVNAGQKIRTPLVAAQDGTSAITIANTTGALTLNTALADSNLATISTAGKVANSATTATSANTASAIVARDASGNFTAGTITATLSGTATQVSQALTAGTYLTSGGTYNGSTARTFAVDATDANTASKVVARDASGNFAAGTITATLNGAAPAGSLSGSTLASGVTASSLTSVGTLTSLTVSGNTGIGGANPGSGRLYAQASAAGTSLVLTDATNSTFKVDHPSSGVTRFRNGSDVEWMRESSGNVAFDTNTLYVDAANNRVGVGTASPIASLNVAGATTGSVIVTRSSNGTTASPVETQIIGSTFTNGTFEAGVYALNSFANNSANWLTFKTTDTGNTTATRMTLDASGNLGLGVTPSAWGTSQNIRALQLNMGAIMTLDNGLTGEFDLLKNAYFDGAAFRYVQSSSGATRYRQYLSEHAWFNAASGTAGNAITFTQAMTLDASGNLLVGTTSASLSAAGRGLVEVNGSTTALYGLKIGGTAYGYLASSTTFTELAAVGASQPLVFTTNSAERVRITSGGDFYINVSTTGNGKLSVRGAGTTSATHSFEAANSSGNTRFLVSDNGLIRFYESSGAESARIDASGNLGVGTASPTSLANYKTITVNGTTGSLVDLASNGTVGARIQCDTTYPGMALFALTNNPMVFGTNGTERARITSGGYFKASNDGTYIDASGSTHELCNTAGSAAVVRIESSHNSAPYGAEVFFTAASPDNNTSWFLNCIDSTTQRCVIYSDGDLANHDGVYGTISDERLKQDIVDAGSQWDDLKAVRFRKYRMKTDVEANPDAPFMLGVIAQELEQTSPGLVDEHPDFEEQEVTDEDGNVTTERVQVGTTKSVKSSILLMKAAVALQEAMARIEALEARLEALEA